MKKKSLGRCPNAYLSSGRRSSVHGLKSDCGGGGGRRHMRIFRHWRMICLVVGLMGWLILFDSAMLAIVRGISYKNGGIAIGGKGAYGIQKKSEKVMYGRLVNLASDALLENKFTYNESLIWEEQYEQASKWKPCANKAKLPRGHCEQNSGYILISANGGLNQQRVAVCNAVIVAALLNATLVIPNFLYSNVWKDTSQFGDIYQEDYFINSLKDEVCIIKELPSYHRSLDVEAVGSQITDTNIIKEAKPIDFIRYVLPLLRKKGVVHFVGFVNRVGFDPLPFHLQRLRCKCNFHALKFVHSIQETGSILVRRVRGYNLRLSDLEAHLFGKYMPEALLGNHTGSEMAAKYLALHMRFEMDMVAYSLCEFGGGENERKELQSYRELHFPALVLRMKNKTLSSDDLRKLGRCPLTPEETALMLSALGFEPRTYIYLAGSQIYEGQSRMRPFTRLYSNLVTKEDLLTPSELAPFRNFSSKLAALDFIACASADVFALTDSGSQLSSLVSGYRIYHGGGRAPTLHPNKKRFARILAQNQTIPWTDFKIKVKKMIEEGQRVHARHKGRSLYRQPRSPGCMCKVR